jgi:hypothetical protein
MLDLFCGRFGWGSAFATRGWEVIGIDLTPPEEVPRGCTFVRGNVFNLTPAIVSDFDFVCASSPCEKFSVWGMRHFFPNPKWPVEGIELFNFTKSLCILAGAPFVMENVRAAQMFIGPAQGHAGSFYLWGNSVPPSLPKGLKKGMRLATGGTEGCGVPNGTRFRDMTAEQKKAIRKTDPMLSASSVSKARKLATARVATIPRELADCVADYAESILSRP